MSSKGMITLKTWYHGPFFDIVGREQEDNIFAERPTLSLLFEALVARYGDGFKEMLFGSETGEISRGILVLVNNRLFPLDTKLKDGDEVAFMMALAGG